MLFKKALKIILFQTNYNFYTKFTKTNTPIIMNNEDLKTEAFTELKSLLSELKSKGDCYLNVETYKSGIRAHIVCNNEISSRKVEVGDVSGDVIGTNGLNKSAKESDLEIIAEGVFGKRDQ